VRIVESERAFCFVAGRGRPAIYVSSRVWSSLSEPERAALVAHEAAHIRAGDLRTRMVIEALLVLAAPLTAARVRAVWLHASERVCDARAAHATGRPESVASAMVSLCRLQASRPAASLGFTPHPDELADRVRAVLAGGPLGERAATRLQRAVTAACAVLVAAAAAAAEPLHHALETLLG
jgi:Zn-dependent protease with chaperone function